MVFSTQQSIEIAGIKDGVVITKNGGYRIILQIAAINFALKSEQEQTSIVFQYQSFLNSLHFPIEIVIRSKRLDLDPYLRKIKALAEKQINSLIQAQTEDYAYFIEKLIGMANIMKKTFYVVVSYDPVTLKKIGFLDKIMNKNVQTFDHLKISDTEFKANTDHLMERANIVASGLGGIGLHCKQLSSEEIIELFYGIYNPDEAMKERVTDADTLSSPVIVSQDEKGLISETKTDQEGSKMIDNSNIVQERKKQEAQEKRLESQKETEREIRSAPSEGPKTVPAGPSVQNQSEEKPTMNSEPIVMPVDNNNQ